MPNINKFAVFSHILPSSNSGQAIMLYRLLESFPSDNYILVLSKNYADLKKEPLSSKKLTGKYYFLTTPTKYKPTIRNRSRKSFLSRISNFLFAAKAQAKELNKILAEENCKTLVVCTGAFFDICFAYFAVRGLKIRFVVYSFDDYVYQWTGLRRIAARLEAAFIFPRADKLIVPNEFLQKEYFSRFGKKSIIVPNPYQSFQLVKKNNFFCKDKINIVYTGSVYFAHFDAFKNLIAAMELIDFPIELHIFTGQPQEELKREGISGKNVCFHKNIDQSEIYSVQKQADISFLPLAFNSPINEVIRTSAPGKMGEYLASGKPVLVHAPADSFVSWYFKKNRCGIVVDKLDVSLLANEIVNLTKSPKERKKMIANAKRCAREDFSIDLARKSFRKAINYK